MQISIALPPTLYSCEPQWQWAPPPLTDHDLWCVLGGSGRISLNGRPHEATARRCFLIGPGTQVHASHDASTPLTVFACHFNFETVAAADPASPPPAPEVNAPFEFPDSILLEQLARHAIRDHRRDQIDGGRRAELCLWQILAAQNPGFSAGPVDPRVDAAIEAIEREPSADWTVPRLARIAGVSPPHFARLFRAATGRSPIRQVIRARISRAQVLLTESHLSLAEIAGALGYRDVFFFTRQFRQETGIPPARFRRENRG